jgi:PAS domain S-box-containing protein
MSSRVDAAPASDSVSDPLKVRMNQRLSQLHWTLVDLAERTGESYRNVHRWMREDVKVPAHFLARFVEVVPVNATWLLSGSGSPHPVEQSAAESALERIAAILTSVRVSTSTGVLAEQVIHGSVDGILAFDRDCRYLMWNPAMTRIAGVEASAVLGRVAFEVFPFLDEIGERQFFEAAIRGETTVADQRRYAVPESGHEGWFEGHYSPLRDASGDIVGGVAIIRDITRWKDELDRLRQGEERYRRLLEMSPDAVMLEADGEIVYVNPAMAELLAMDAAELAGRPVGEIVSREGSSASWPSGGTGGFEAHNLMRGDGREVPVEVRRVGVELDGRPGTQALFRSLTPA